MTFRLAILGDLHYPLMHSASEQQIVARDTFYQSVFEQFFAEEADLYISVGDVTHTGHRLEWQGIADILSEYRDKPFRFVLGNHDTLAQNKASVLSQMHQSRYFQERLNDNLLLFLDTTHEGCHDN